MCIRFDPFLPGFTKLLRFLLGFTGFYWVLLGFTGFYWVLLGFTGFQGISLAVNHDETKITKKSPKKWETIVFPTIFFHEIP